jgi:hypothetical protein
MIIVEHDSSRAAVWKDPLYEIGFTQLQEEIVGLTKLTESPDVHERQIFDLCDGLCELSRDLLFRLHRVTRSELVSLISAFQHASDAIAAAIGKIQEQQLRQDAEGYLKHINGRISILSGYVDSPAEQR